MGTHGTITATQTKHRIWGGLLNSMEQYTRQDTPTDNTEPLGWEEKQNPNFLVMI